MSEKGLKVTSIVEDVINKNKTEFLKKTKLQQDTDRANIEDAIMLSLAGRDNFERKIILSEISKSVNDPSNYFFDSKGNFDISGFKKFTQNTVKEAEYNGIIEPIGNKQNKNQNKIINDIKNVVLTVAIMDKMIKDYNNLSKDEQINLISNFHNMNMNQKHDMIDKMNEELKQYIENSTDEEEKGTYRAAIECNSKYKEFLNLIINNNIDEIKKFLKENPNFIAEYNKKNSNEQIKNIDDIKDIKQAKEILDANDANLEDINSMCMELNKLRGKPNPTPEDIEKMNKYIEKIGCITKSIIEKTANDKESISKSEDISKPKLNSNLLDNVLDIENNKKLEDENKADQRSTLKEEIQQIPVALIKAGFSKEQVTETLNIYKNMLEDLTDEDIHNENDNILNILYDKADKLELDKSSEEILGIILPLTYEEQENSYSLQGILADSENRKRFFEELDSSINRDFENDQDIEIAGELGEYVNQYIKEKEMMNSAKSELLAISIALEGIECSPEEISKGFKVYGEIIEGLSDEELEDKSSKEINKLLENKVKESELTGQSAVITEMLSQIEFDGNLKDILQNSRDEFVEAINNTKNEDKSIDFVKEDEGKKQISDKIMDEAFKHLAVDLMVADQRNIDQENNKNIQDLENGNNEVSTEKPIIEEQNNLSNNGKKFKINDVKNSTKGVKMSEIQDSAKLIHVLREEVKGYIKTDDEQEMETV